MTKSIKLRGIEDITGKSWTILKSVQKALSDVFVSHGYRFIETPILEPTDLFVRKGGGEITTQMYSFSTPHGRQVSIRPEFTSSIVRHCIEGEILPPLPSRLQYSGPVFRFDLETGDNHHFHQSGIELMGSDHPRSDSEVLSLSCLGLSTLGVEHPRLVITDLNIFSQILEYFGLSDRGKLFIMNQIGTLQKGGNALLQVKEKAKTFGLLGPEKQPTIDIDDVSLMSETKARQIIAQMLTRDDMGSLGRRTPNQITERLLRKMWGDQDSSKMNSALEIVSTLATVTGDPKDCLERTKSLLKEHGLMSISLEKLEQVLNLLNAGDIGDTSVVVDFGLARGMSYYTGIVFELTDPTGEISFGGGRYDELAASLGSRQKMPALGFAYNLEYLISYIRENSKHFDPYKNPAKNTLVLPLNAEAYAKALQIAKDLRIAGNNVELDVCMRNLQQSMEYASSNDIELIIAVGERGVEKEYNVR